MTKRVFISYRREDTAYAAGRIYDRLCRKLPQTKVFIDVTAIRGGEKFEQRTLSEISRSDAALVFIGKKWMEPRPGEDQARICESDDYVRAEVRSVLNREMLVLPVLVDGALMPAPDLLPEDVRPLTARNALILRHDRFDDDAENIFAAILRVAAKHGPWHKKKPLARLGFAILGLILGLAVLVTAAIVHQAVMGRPLGASIGTEFTILLLIASTVVGAGLGFYYDARKRRIW
jgi:hypothetical protein